MKIALYVISGLAAIVLVVVLVGYWLPEKHRVSRERSYAVTATRLFAAITTVPDFPKWRTGVQRAEVLPPDSGRISFREMSGDGTLTYVVEESVPDRRLVTRIADRSLPFGGSWTYEITDAGGRSTLRITEDGEVYNPVFRFMSRFVFGHHATMDRYLADLDTYLTGAGPSP